ncbi:hypothetical protein BDN71DRAFT_1510282 [Pleurotus eryngii]|uniref:Uncharacterized protein n=1 Tax=Pleurotus eryngii TaxID=5323 RepID=A0A9P6DC85_PLEER|nr:hypothetical protein BDN71DRAFT_1510282 [Pleurotus eryngii]
MHVTVLISGPEPKKGGQLNVLSLHTGTNLSPVPKTWGEADKEKYQLVTQNFKELLHTAYTQQQQIDAAIPHTLPQNLDSLLVMEHNTPDDPKAFQIQEHGWKKKLSRRSLTSSKAKSRSLQVQKT